MNTKFNYKLKLLTNKKDKGSGLKLGRGYVIPGGVCDFRNLCDF